MPGTFECIAYLARFTPTELTPNLALALAQTRQLPSRLRLCPCLTDIPRVSAVAILHGVDSRRRSSSCNYCLTTGHVDHDGLSTGETMWHHS